MSEKVGRTFRALLVARSDSFTVQLVRYTVVGGFAFVLDFGTLWGLTELAGLHYLVSAALGFMVGLATNYTLSVLWVFSKRRIAGRWLEFLLFAIIGVVGLALTELFMWVFTAVVGLYYLLSKILTTAVVYAWNFLARRFTLFS